MSRQTRTRAFSAVALGVAAVLLWWAIPATAEPTTALPDGRFTLVCDVVGGKVTQCTPPAEPTPTAEPTTSAPTTSAPTTTSSPTTPPPATTPPATPTPTPTPSPTQSPTGWPNASTTGATGTLTLRTGNLTISTPGAVVENLDVRGCVSITAVNVVFRNSKVTCTADVLAAVTAKTLGGVVIEGVDVSCANTPKKGLLIEGATVRRADVSQCEDGVYIDRNAVVVDSYIHDLYEIDRGAGVSDRYGHTDGIQVTNDGDNVTLRGNYVANRTPHATSAYIGDGPNMNNIIMDGNYLEGGGYTIRCSTSGSGNVLSNNTITRGYWGYWTYCDRSGIVRTGNVLI